MNPVTSIKEKLFMTLVKGGLNRFYFKRQGVLLKWVCVSGKRQGSTPGCYCFCCCLVAKSCPTHLWPRVIWWTIARQLLCPWDFPGKNARVNCHFLVQGIFLTQGPNLGLLHRQIDSLPLSHQSKPATPGMTRKSGNLQPSSRVGSMHGKLLRGHIRA